MRIWGTAAFAQLRLIIKRRALPEPGLISSARSSKPVTTSVRRDSAQQGRLSVWMAAVIGMFMAMFRPLTGRLRPSGGQRPARRRGLHILVLPVLLGVGLMALTLTTPAQPVAAASTFDQNAMDNAQYSGTWYVFPDYNNPVSATQNNGADIYLDSTGTLHVSGLSGKAALAPNIAGNVNVASVKTISFEGPSIFVDASLGLFQKFPNLEKITGLGNIDVSRMTTMDYLFSAHSSDAVGAASTNGLLKTIEGTSNWNTSNVTSMKYTFEDQPNLTSVDGIQNWNTSKVTNMHSLFYLDKSLTTLPSLSGWDTSKVTDTAYAFSGMSALTSIDSILNWKMQSNTDFEGMFADDPKLKFGGRLNWDTSAGVNFSKMFRNDTGMTSLNLSNWNVAKGDDFSDMFNTTSGLTSLDISGWQPTNATQMGFMFYNDAKLTTLPGIDGWTLTKAEDLTSMFEGMSSVADLPVSKWQLNSSTHTNITNIFWGDNALTKLDLSGWHVTDSWDASDKVFPTYNYSSSALQSQLKSITFGQYWTGKVVLPQFLLNGGKYGPWRGEKHDKANVSGVGTATETYTPPSTTADRAETFRFGYDIIAKLVNSQGKAVTLADMPIIVQDSNGTEVLRGTTGADGTVTLPMNSTGGSYTVKLGDLPGGYDAVVDTATAKVDGADVEVTLVVDQQNDADLIAQYPHAGGHGTFLTVVAGVLAVALGTAGMVVRRRA